MNIMENTKVCCKCNRELSIECFTKNKTKKDGLQSWCRECSNKYHQTYEQTNRQYLNQQQKEYRNQFKGYYVYIILNKQGDIVYVGQTSNYYTRLYQHLSENVNATQELFANNDWSSIQYLNVEHIVANEAELRALENELIELYNPKLNKAKNIIRDIDRGRLFSLLAQLHGILNEWEIFRTNI